MSVSEQSIPQAGDDLAGLGHIAPELYPVEVRGEQLQLREVPLRSLGAFSRAARPLLPYLLAALDDPELLYEQHGDALLAFLAIGADRDAAWAGALSDDEGMRLLAGVLKMNRPFLRRLMKSQAAKAPPPGTGQTPSIPSSATGT